MTVRFLAPAARRMMFLILFLALSGYGPLGTSWSFLDVCLARYKMKTMKPDLPTYADEDEVTHLEVLRRGQKTWQMRVVSFHGYLSVHPRRGACRWS